MRHRLTARPTAHAATRASRGAGAVVAALLMAGLAGCGPVDTAGTVTEPTAAAAASSDTSSDGGSKKTDGGSKKSGEGSSQKSGEGSKQKAGDGTALAALADLTIKGRAPKTGYDRDQFGPAWADVDHNGCDTRNDILTRDLTRPTYKSGTHDCVVLTGRLADPYTATVIEFQRGQDTSTAVQIDHAVALSDAWQKGAQQIDEETRRQLANDPLNLYAVDGPTNGAKGDGDAATWLPPNTSFRCEYVARQIAVKRTYDLWITGAEHDAMERVLSSCPDEPLPEGGLAPTVQAATAQPEPTTESQPSGSGSADPEPESVHYENCTEVREAGADPVRRGDPGYADHLDRDGDGVGCE
ncbi:GmrSD restriction endonuclease domain-containing protein [Isoptericola aurantiacus]|uniref:GmrSD restriction endonuclease domain-containing protein n=1 Tax=Isoptericola aurantiacus TaxID=3377839 RepID=UPI00383A442E